MIKKLCAVHGKVYAAGEKDEFGYFGWPSVCLTDDGTLYAGASGFRNSHICPFGKTVLFSSKDLGTTWGNTQIVNNSMIDDRDVGLLALPGNEMLLSWFTSDIRVYGNRGKHGIDFGPVLDSWDEETVANELGSLIRIRRADGSWMKKQFVKVTSPHGPVRLKNGHLFYPGVCFGQEKSGRIRGTMAQFLSHSLMTVISIDNGHSWEDRAFLPSPAEKGLYSCEPHALELPDGRILCMMRTEGNGKFETHQCFSGDEGKTWSPPEKVCDGAPPHLMLHSSGTIVCSYGWRTSPFGDRIMFSTDLGRTWDKDWILRDDGPSRDLGYPCSVELPGGDVLTVYYQAPHENTDRNAILHSRWSIPALK